MTLISARDSAHHFIVKFSPSVGVAIVAGEMPARSFAYHAHGTAESDKSYAMTKQQCINIHSFNLVYRHKQTAYILVSCIAASVGSVKLTTIMSTQQASRHLP